MTRSTTVLPTVSQKLAVWTTSTLEPAKVPRGAAETMEEPSSMNPVRMPAQMFFVFMDKHAPFLFDKVDIGRYQEILALLRKIYLRLLRQDAYHSLQKDGTVFYQKPVIGILL